MREKLMTLSAAELKELAKSQGMKGASGKRKAELVEWLASRWEEEVKRKELARAAKQSQAAAETAVSEAAPAEAADTPEKAPEQKRQTRRGRPRKRPEAPAVMAAQQRPEAPAPAAQQPQENPPAPAVQELQENPAPAVQESQENPAPAEQKPVIRETASAADNAVPAAQSPAEAAPAVQFPAEAAPAVQSPAEAAPAVPQEAPSEAVPVPQEPEIRLPEELQSIADKGPPASGILELHPDGFGFLRTGNYLSGTDDVYVSQSQIRRFGMRTGDLVTGIRRARGERDKNAGLLFVSSVNGLRPSEIQRRDRFDDMTPIFPDQRIHLEVPGASTAMRLVDLISPIGKGQRGMIVSPPKAGKTTLLKQIAKVITDTCPEIHLIILLIDERPEEVTDIREYIQGPQVEVAASTFDREPEQHRKLAEMVIERARRLVESHMDVVILLDSITRLARAYNLVVTPSGRTLSGGLDPAALNMPKRFFGAARNMREGGSLTILATALVDTGSRMDDVIYEEFKGTGNMELVLDRKLSERRIFPAVDILKSGTRRDDLLLSREEREVLDMIHRATNGNRPEESVERILDMFSRTRSNAELIRQARYNRRI